MGRSEGCLAVFNLVDTYASSMLGWNIRFMKPAAKKTGGHNISPLCVSGLQHTTESCNKRKINNKKCTVPILKSPQKRYSSQCEWYVLSLLLPYKVLVGVCRHTHTQLETDRFKQLHTISKILA